MLATGSDDGCSHVYDLRNLSLPFFHSTNMRQDELMVKRVRFSPYGKYGASCDRSSLSSVSISMVCVSVAGMNDTHDEADPLTPLFGVCCRVLAMPITNGMVGLLQVDLVAMQCTKGATLPVRPVNIVFLAGWLAHQSYAWDGCACGVGGEHSRIRTAR